ncbi:hypothetical protein L596_017641 [Steinernema carpocapsae]|uniref:Secreted protein n=1 Tax=Steinernema carpocapsae TaxID=34508 RepID=A0A4U5N292_STECR|nr:hypothetical protein L596_017641 [Steinernema carpocapsae]
MSVVGFILVLLNAPRPPEATAAAPNPVLNVARAAATLQLHFTHRRNDYDDKRWGVSHSSHRPSTVHPFFALLPRVVIVWLQRRVRSDTLRNRRQTRLQTAPSSPLVYFVIVARSRRRVHPTR